MNKNHKKKKKKKNYEKENGFVIISIFAICYHTDKQKNNILFSWYTSSRSTYNTVLQYLQDNDHWWSQYKL